MRKKLALESRNIISRLLPFCVRRLIPETIFKHFYPKGLISLNYQGNSILKIYSEGHQLENEIHWKGLEGWTEKKSISVWIELCELMNPSQIWDIGANTGIYGLIAKHFSPESKIQLFDPLSRCIEITKLNFKVNNLDADIHHCALGNFTGKANVFLESPDNFAYSVTVNKNLNPLKSRRILEIDVERSENFIDNVSSLPELIKIDVETFEPEVLEGFGNVDFRNSVFLIEILNDEVAKQIEKSLPPKDFIYLNIDDINNKISEQSNLTKSDLYNFLILPRNSKRIDTLKILGTIHSKA